MLNENKTFFNCISEEKWLNTMAQRGLLLADRKFCTYGFAYTQEQYTVSVVKMHNAVNNGDSEEEIKAIEAQGYTYICGYKCWAYFKGANKYEAGNKEYFRHYGNIALLLLASYTVSAGVLAYQINFTLLQMLNAQTLAAKTVLVIFAVLTFAFLIPLIYYTYLTTLFRPNGKKRQKKQKAEPNVI
ncbi:MAG TPA: DUF2812 domain-containing protein [Bacillota bacterium]|nr:DUF2812 domain-containing protein [Bacillota bacterium]